ncbi:MAG: ATP-binding protein [Gemmatimonadaceae bacterium]
MTLTIQRVLLGTVVLTILGGMIPAGLVLDRRLGGALSRRMRDDLALGPRVLNDRVAANSDALMMHAKELAHTAGLGAAMVRGNRDEIRRLIELAHATTPDTRPVAVAATGESLLGPTVDSAIVRETRLGRMPVVMTSSQGEIRTVALAPVEYGGRWVGAAGMTIPMDERAAQVLAGLTRSGVVIVVAGSDAVTITTLDSITTRAVVAALARSVVVDTVVHAIDAGRTRVLMASAPLGTVGTIVFTRAVADELAVLPELRRVALASAVAALVAALVLGAALASRVSRPIRQLAAAAAAMANGEFDAPLPRSRVRELARVASAFDAMRRTLAMRLQELGAANATLAEHSTRLSALQSDLMQRDRLSATGQLVAQLAHEIRNPVANVRNLLELLRRRLAADPEAREFAEMAIDELLRMHELAEQMLDLNRPRDPAIRRSRPVAVARDVARLVTAGALYGDRASPDGESLEVPALAVRVRGPDEAEVAIAPDALKQVLLNLVQNAREAIASADGCADRLNNGAGSSTPAIDIIVSRAPSGATMDIVDNGPGIPPDMLARVFDPFVTTKHTVQGVGLGLFVAEGLVRTAGGRLSVSNRETGGACFRIELPLAAPLDASTRDVESPI